MALVCWLLASGPVWPGVCYAPRWHMRVWCVPFNRSSQREVLGVIRPSSASASKRLIGEPHLLDAEGNFEGSSFQSGGALRSMWPASNGPFHPTMPGPLYLGRILGRSVKFVFEPYLFPSQDSANRANHGWCLCRRSSNRAAHGGMGQNYWIQFRLYLTKAHLDLFKLQPLRPVGVLVYDGGRGRWQYNRHTLLGVADRPLRPALHALRAKRGLRRAAVCC